MAEYAVKEVGHTDTSFSFEVSKFQGDTVTAVYTIAVYPKKNVVHCDCDWGSRHRGKDEKPCRHVKMVCDFVKAGKPQPYFVEMP